MDGWGLMHSLLADVVKMVMAATSAESSPDAKGQNTPGSSWSILSDLAADPCKANVLGKAKCIQCREHFPVSLLSCLDLLRLIADVRCFAALDNRKTLYHYLAQCSISYWGPLTRPVLAGNAKSYEKQDRSIISFSPKSVSCVSYCLGQCDIGSASIGNN